EMWGLFSQITNAVFLVTCLASLIIALSAKQLVSLEIGIAPGFSSTQQALVSDLMRLNLIATILFSLGGLAIAGLQSQQHFLVPALAPAMYDIGSLFGILILAPEQGYQLGPITLPAYNLGVYGLVYGVIIGAALFMLIQIPALIKFGFRWSPKLNLKDPGVVKVLHLMGPRVITVFFIQLVFILQDNLASRLPTGSVTALVYGWLFMQLPESLIGTALGTALLPTLSEQIANDDIGNFRSTLEKTIRVITALTLPIAVVLAINLGPLIQVLGFTETGTNLVLWTSRAYLVGLVGHSLLEVAARSFYARHDAKTPLIASGLTMAAFAILAIPLSRSLGAPGIGLANSIAYTGEALLLFILLYRKMPFNPRLKKTLLRAIAASIIGAGLSILLQTLVGTPTSTMANLALTLGILTLAGGLILPLLLPVLRDLLNI
ncbi:MAG: polysaccharide biosynthesis C-terminal domain-containing protein, partial [Anaerolineales bacterium]|nr:polysaccharide biosynthesis C-terminal domain-containing protein [Anaerolineales bacterium]